MQDPLAIYQAHLDRVSELVWARELDAVVDLLMPSGTIETDDGVFRVNSLSDHLSNVLDLRSVLDDMISGCQYAKR